MRIRILEIHCYCDTTMFAVVVLNCLLAFASANLQNMTQSEPLSNVLKINRVVGGKNSEKGEFPHQVTLQLISSHSAAHVHLCGGSIIADRWILTAGHCVRNLPFGEKLVVKAGKYSLKTKETTEQTVHVTNIYVHKQYKGGSTPFDIALLQLLTPLTFNKYVTPISLPRANSIPRGSAILSGWGSISKSDRAVMPDTLQKVTLSIIDFETCKRAFRDLGEQWQNVHYTHVCTGPLTGGYSACQGDSGGPLIRENEKGSIEIIGVVSWGLIPCGVYGAPAVFVRVSAFVDWINHIMEYYNYV